MGSNTLLDKSSGDTVDETWRNEINTAVKGDWLPRNSSGVPANLEGDLGDATRRWKQLWVESINLDGTTLDSTTISTAKNKILSGRTHANHNGARYLLPDGTAATVTLKAGAGNPDFRTVIDGTLVEITSDIVISGLTLAPGSNNTALVNDTDYADQELTKLTGEQIVTINNSRKNTGISYDTVGSEITSRTDSFRFMSLDNGSTTEVILAKIGGSGMNRILRGYGYDSSEVDQARIVFSDDDVLTLLQANWIFLDIDGSTTYATLNIPIHDAESPGSPTTNDYWFNTVDEEWNRYNGSTWDVVQRNLLGVAICDSSGCKWAFSWPFFHVPKGGDNNFFIERFNNSIARTLNAGSNASISVYGKQIILHGIRLEWSTTSLDTGESEAASTLYYLYVKDTGRAVITAIAPRPYDWKLGEYHPHKPWRCMGIVFNNASSDLDGASHFGNHDRLRLETTNGRGSTSVARLRYGSVTDQFGSSITYVDSATLGAILTVQRTGRYTIMKKFLSNAVSTDFLIGGITKNAFSGTVNVSTSDEEDVMTSHHIQGGSTAAANHLTCVYSGILYQGDKFYSQYFAQDPQAADGFLDVHKIGDLYDGGTPITNGEI